MRILSISILNIHSLKGLTQLKFNEAPLNLTGIFTITGPTGAGKSTLLDAITLALYNQIPRIGKISSKMLKEIGGIITQNTTNAYTELEYEVNGKQYRSKWEIQYSQRTGELQDYSMEVAEIPNGLIISSKRSEVPERNTEIIGLNYEQFVKSIILAQGDFSKFLKADVNSRGELLEKITGTEIYREIGKAAFQKHKEEVALLESVEEKFKNMKLIPDEQINELQGQLNLAASQLPTKQEVLKRYNNVANIKKQLINLKNEYSKILLDQHKLATDNEHFKPQLLKLEKSKKLEKITVEIQEFKRYKSEYELITKNEITLSTEIKNISAEIDANSIKENELIQNIDNQNIVFSSLLQKCKEARELDLEKINIDKNLKTKQLTINNKEKELNELIALINALKNNSLHLTQNKENLTKWIADNTILADLSSELPLINDKKNTFEQLRKPAKDYIKKNAPALLMEKAKELTSWFEFLQLFDNEINKVNTEISEKFGSQIYTIDDLNLVNEQLNQIRKKVTDLQKIYELSKKHSEISIEILNIKKKIIEFENEQQQLSNEIEKQQITKQIQSNDLSVLIKINERLLLEAKYEDDRKKLQPGQPCFLCGSEHHPYVTKYEANKELIEEQIEKKQSELQSTDNEIKKFEKRVSQIIALYKEQNISLQKAEKEQETIKNSFALACLENSVNFDLDNISQISIQISENELIANELKIKEPLIQKYISFKNIYEKLISCKDEIKRMVELENSVNSLLDKYLLFFQNCKTLETKIIAATEKANEYAANKELLLSTENEINKNNLLLSEKNTYYEKISKELSTETIDIKQIKFQLELIISKRKEILGDLNPDNEENKKRNEIELLKKSLSDIQKELAKLKTLELSKKQTVEEIILRKEQNIRTTTNLEKVLNEKIIPLGYQQLSDAITDLLPDNEKVRLEEIQKQISEQLFAIEKLVAAKKAEVEKLSRDDNPAMNDEIIKTNIKSLETEIQELNKKIWEYNNTISQNNLKKEESESLVNQLDNQKIIVERWSKLNNLIGDAKGKKFSSFAQDLTMKHLMLLSNKHLQKFSPRYEIEMGDDYSTQNLFVRDKWLANTRRAVNTLSGGETFLLSLALALALSDMASRNLKIESLFIDEGFGVLDSETLDLAISTLERLQSETKRTIGIISHIPALKDRISTQIEIIKTGAGHSEVKVLA